MGQPLALVAAILVAITFIEWFRRAFATRIPTKRGGFILAMSTGVILGAASILISASSPPGARFAVVAGSLFLLLNRFSAMDDKKIAVQVGGPIIEFSARDENGDTFNLADVIGRPFLLKFFRGHW